MNVWQIFLNQRMLHWISLTYCNSSLTLVFFSPFFWSYFSLTSGNFGLTWKVAALGMVFKKIFYVSLPSQVLSLCMLWVGFQTLVQKLITFVQLYQSQKNFGLIRIVIYQLQILTFPKLDNQKMPRIGDQIAYLTDKYFYSVIFHWFLLNMDTIIT